MPRDRCRIVGSWRTPMRRAMFIAWTRTIYSTTRSRWIRTPTEEVNRAGCGMAIVVHPWPMTIVIDWTSLISSRPLSILNWLESKRFFACRDGSSIAPVFSPADSSGSRQSPTYSNGPSSDLEKITFSDGSFIYVPKHSEQIIEKKPTKHSVYYFPRYRYNQASGNRGYQGQRGGSEPPIVISGGNGADAGSDGVSSNSHRRMPVDRMIFVFASSFE